MAEAIGVIIGEYTIPSDLPILYITDSNNAHTLQRNIKFRDKFAHCKLEVMKLNSWVQIIIATALIRPRMIF